MLPQPARPGQQAASCRIAPLPAARCRGRRPRAAPPLPVQARAQPTAASITPARRHSDSSRKSEALPWQLVGLSECRVPLGEPPSRPLCALPLGSGAGQWASAAGPVPRLGRRRNEEEATVGPGAALPALPGSPAIGAGCQPAPGAPQPTSGPAPPLSPPAAAAALPPLPRPARAGPRSSPQIDVPLPLPAAVLGRRHVGRLQGARAALGLAAAARQARACRCGAGGMQTHSLPLPAPPLPPHPPQANKTADRLFSDKKPQEPSEPAFVTEAKLKWNVRRGRAAGRAARCGRTRASWSALLPSLACCTEALTLCATTSSA